MSKRLSMRAASPEPDAVNPYDNARRQNEYQQHRRQNSNLEVIINDDPVIPQYKIEQNFVKNSNYNMKIVVVGDGGCGKTCLLVSYAQQKFPEIYVPTVFENYVTKVRTPNNKLIELALWDTAGQEEYDRLRPLSYPDVDLLLVCFALDNITSLHNVKDIWYPEVNHFCPGIPILLVGTKSDLPNHINPDLAIQLATEIGAIGYIQCSAKTMFNISTVFNFGLYNFHRRHEAAESKKRRSFLGHSRTQSAASNRSKGHFKNSSLDSSLFDRPLHEEDDTPQNPYLKSAYNDDEFAFTRRDKKSRKCTIL